MSITPQHTAPAQDMPLAAHNIPLAVQGMSCLGSFGQGSAALVAGLHAPGRLHCGTDGATAAPQADTSLLSELLPPKALRQTEHFTRLVLLGALLCMQHAGIDTQNQGADTAIILATGYGPATPTFDFLDSVIEYGEKMASPLAFSHSVQNIPAASLALKLGMTGPCLTVCQPENAVGAALFAARDWLREGRARRVILGAVDELTPLLGLLTRRLADERKAQSPGWQPGRSTFPVSGGACFFCLDMDVENARVGVFRDVAMLRRDVTCLCRELHGDGLPVFVSGSVPPELGGIAGVSRLTHAYGNLPVAQAFDLSLALCDPALTPNGKAVCASLGRGGLAGLVTVERRTTEEEGV